MCNIWPRPRCAFHTGAEYAAKKKARIAKEVAFRKAEAEYASVSGQSSSTTHQVRAYRRALEEKLAAYTDAVTEEKSAELIWHSTPTGQEALEHDIAVAQERGDESAVNRLSAELVEAKEIRLHQVQAGKLIDSAQSRLSSLTEEQRGELDSLAKDVERAQSELQDNGVFTKEASQALVKAEAELDAERRTAAQGLIKVRAHHDKIALKVRTAYLDAEVPRDMANHYTLDTMKSLQTGWEYPSPDSTDRLPAYKNEIVIKQKGEDHDGEHSTNLAAYHLSEDSEFKELMEENSRVQGEYSRSIEPIKEAARKKEEARLVMDESVNVYDRLTADVRESEKRWTTKKADFASGQSTTKTYDVAGNQFIKSAHLNGDGTTNAFVYSDNIGSGVPAFVPVEGRGRDKKGGFITLINGDKIYSSELNNHSLRLVAPEQGAQRFFAVK